MIRMSVLYPKGEGTTFDHDYYRNKHVPLCLSTWNLSSAAIDKGIDGPYEAAVHFEFDSTDAMQSVLGGPGTAAVMGDVANYTNIAPVIQVSEIIE